MPFRAVLALALVVWTLGGGAEQAAGQSVYRTGVDLVGFNVTVVDRDGYPVSDLTAEDFEIREDGAVQSIQYFAREGDAEAAPLHVGLLFDTSGSMEKDLDFSRTAAIRFLRLFPTARDFTFVDFSTEVRAARFSQGDFPRLVERIRNRPAKGYTALYDALAVYLDGAMAQSGRKVLVLYSDGGDTSSSQSWNETWDILRASDVTVFPLGFLKHQSAGNRLQQETRLRQIADATGGRAFFPGSLDQLDEIYAAVADEIHTQYSLGYVSTNSARDGKWREVEIRLRPATDRRLTLRTRKGYFAPAR
jgi:Ca-activated chloride channel family protein